MLYRDFIRAVFLGTRAALGAPRKAFGAAAIPSGNSIDTVSLVTAGHRVASYYRSANLDLESDLDEQPQA
jgi:hypothetical protein